MQFSFFFVKLLEMKLRFFIKIDTKIMVTTPIK